MRGSASENVALIAGMAPGTCIFFLSLKNEIIKKQGAGVEPRPLASPASVITTTLPANRLLKPEKFRKIKWYPYYFTRTNRIG